jgi:hypothetical protein
MKTNTRTSRIRSALAVVALPGAVLAGCTRTGHVPAGTTTGSAPTSTTTVTTTTAATTTPIVATFEVAGERFRARFTDPVQIDLVRRTRAGAVHRFPSGTVVWGATGDNTGYPWHLEQARMVEMAIELCDGRPSDVVEDRWKPPTFCPWGAQVVAVEEAAAAPGSPSPR